MPSPTFAHFPQGAYDCNIHNGLNNVNLLELLQTLSNEQVLRLIPKSAVDNLHQISNLIRNGDYNSKDFGQEGLSSPLPRSPPSLTSSPPPVSPKARHHGITASDELSTPKARGQNKAKRPLNGFIVFRAYYQRIFTQVSQRSISALITQLWKNDPFHSRWMLIGRVYSFIRDTVGNRNAKLSDFLEIAVPIMGVPVPEEYLVKLCWVYSGNDAGEVAFFQDAIGLQRYLASISHFQIPSTEQDLLNFCLVNNYLPDHGDALLAKLAQNNSFLITIHDRPSRRNYYKPAFQQTMSIPMPLPRHTLDSDEFMSFTMAPMQMHLPPTGIPTMTSQGENIWLASPASPLPAAYIPQQYEPEFDIFNMPMHGMYDVMDGFNPNGSVY